jgi:hypothetical protein
MRVHRTPLAIAHLLAVYKHMAQDTPWYAQRLIARRTERSKQSATSPQLGCLLSEDVVPDRREVIERRRACDLYLGGIP